MTVEAGDPVAEWLDCDQILIDMPVSDAEAALILSGESAEVCSRATRQREARK